MNRRKSGAKVTSPMFAHTGLSPKRALGVASLAATGLIFAVFVWQGIASSGNPNPLAPGTSDLSASFDIAVLVFREGLECILMLAAVTASMTGSQQVHRWSVAVGAGVGFLVTLLTWSLAVRLLDDISDAMPALDLQAVTGLLAVIVLLVVMNWFFHKLYWTGWIALHNRKKRDLLTAKADPSKTTRALWGLGLLGFSSLYREGVEVVLFLQSYRLKLGSAVISYGVLLGLFFSGIVAILTFVAHRKLPYRKMLVLTGIMLGAVLLVMVGEQTQEMQLAHWLPTTPIPRLANKIPAWMGLWFSIFPTLETLAGQTLALVLVVGSYFLAQRPVRTHQTRVGRSLTAKPK